MLAVGTHASHYMHFHVRTLTDAALPCKTLFLKVTAAKLCCRTIRLSAHISVHDKHSHTRGVQIKVDLSLLSSSETRKREREQLEFEHPLWISLLTQGNGIFLPIKHCDML